MEWKLLESNFADELLICVIVTAWLEVVNEETSLFEFIWDIDFEDKCEDAELFSLDKLLQVDELFEDNEEAVYVLLWLLEATYVLVGSRVMVANAAELDNSELTNLETLELNSELICFDSPIDDDELISGGFDKLDIT